MQVYIYSNPESPSLSRPQHQGDAGYDVITTSKPSVVGEESKEKKGYYESVDYIEYETNIHLAPDNSIYSLCYPRSSVSKYNLLLANAVGVIDSGYRNSVKFRFKYVFQPRDLAAKKNGGIMGKVDFKKIYEQGDKIGQIIFAAHCHPSLDFVINKEELPLSDRGLGGFGSTGR